MKKEIEQQLVFNSILEELKDYKERTEHTIML